MLIELWPDDNSTGYMLVDSNIIGIVDRALDPKHLATRQYFILLKSGATIRVSKDSYEQVENHLERISNAWDNSDRVNTVSEAENVER